MDALVNYALIINEIKLINHKISGGPFNIDPIINRNISSIDESKASVTYTLEISNTPEHPFPIDVFVSLTGVFDISKLDKKDVDDFLRIQSCQIIFPQIRSIVATLTSSAFIQPILLPVIDARKLFATSNPATKE